MIKKILILLLLSSCLNSHKIQNLESLPEFYVTPKQNNQSFLYGVGGGYNLHSSTKSALSNASSKLMTNISANMKLLSKSYNDNISEQSRQQINEKLEKITFNNYKISNSANFNNQIYVEVAIDRDNFIKQNSQKIKNINQRFENLSKNIEQKNIIDQYRNLRKINSKLYEVKILNIILDSVKYEDIDYNKNHQKYNQYQNQFDNLIEKMIFKIDSKADKKIANIVKKGLSDQKIKIINNSHNLQNLILVKINQEEVSDKIYGSFIVKLRVNIQLINQGKILSTNFIESVGSSVISQKEARNSAILEIYNKIQEESIEKIIAL